MGCNTILEHVERLDGFQSDRCRYIEDEAQCNWALTSDQHLCF